MNGRAYTGLKVAAEVAVPLALLAAWQLWTVHAGSQYFPRLSTILVEFREMWLFSQFGTHVVPSLERMALGYGIAVVAGIALGIPLGLSRWARVAAMPHIEYWRAIPPPALLPISVLLLHSIGNLQKVSFIAFFCLFPVLLNTIDGVRAIDPTTIDTARSYGVRGLRADQADRPARRHAADRSRDAHQPRARGDHDGAHRVLLEHERRRLRLVDLEEHLPARADVGGDPVDRRARIPRQPGLRPGRAAASRLAPGLARDHARVAAMSDGILEIKSLGKTYLGKKETHAIADVSLSVADGEFLCVVGPSGCGKTTLLKCVAGLMRPTKGTVHLRGKPVTKPPEELALVFQEYSRSLMPWTSVGNNVLLPLRHKKLARKERRRLVEESLEAVGLTAFADHYPWQLSGGMQQRVAIARALAYQPSILLMDEPFASVDAQTRGDLEDLILRVREEYAITILFVTHDIDESVYLADRVVVLTHAPTEVKEVVSVHLPRPRDQIATKELPDFAHLRAHVYRLIKREQAATPDAGAEATLARA